jgi:putative transposase
MKPNVYSEVYLHLVFSPKFRKALIKEEIQPAVFSYISGVITQKGFKSINVNGMPDHIHILTGLNPQIAVTDLVRDVKRSSSLFINENKLVPIKFQWQEGFGVFSYSRSQLGNVFNYIQNQKQHHTKSTFRKEYTGILEKFGVDYNEKFLFEFFD